LLCIEARTVLDPLYGVGENVGRNAFLASTTHSEQHYRRFIVLGELISALHQLKFEIVFSGQQSGWAKYQDEDPVVLRIVAKRI
jgi:hypothetical protein